jgi:delta14-sterol reductase
MPAPPPAAVTKADKAYADLNPVTEHYEFGGPLGAVGVTLAVPFFTYCLSPLLPSLSSTSLTSLTLLGLAFACTESSCPPWPLSSFGSWHSEGLKAMLGGQEWWESLWSWEATAVYFGWYMWTVVCWMALPGKEVEGVELRNGRRLTYTMNGLSVFSFSS